MHIYPTLTQGPIPSVPFGPCDYSTIPSQELNTSTMSDASGTPASIPSSNTPHGITMKSSTSSSLSSVRQDSGMTNSRSVRPSEASSFLTTDSVSSHPKKVTSSKTSSFISTSNGIAKTSAASFIHSLQSSTSLAPHQTFFTDDSRSSTRKSIVSSAPLSTASLINTISKSSLKSFSSGFLSTMSTISTLPVSVPNSLASSPSSVQSTFRPTVTSLSLVDYAELTSTTLYSSSSLSTSSTRSPQISSSASISSSTIVPVISTLQPNVSSVAELAKINADSVIKTPNWYQESSTTSTQPIIISSTSSAAITPPSATFQYLVLNPTPTGSPTSTLSPNLTYLDEGATPQQQAACLNYAAHQSQQCWGVLNVTGFAQDWVSKNQAKCALEDMGFGDCFYFLEGLQGQNCTSFTGRSQCDNPNPATFSGQTFGAQKFYVAFNIWNIQNWFYTYYEAITAANAISLDFLPSLCRVLNIPIPKAFPLLDLLSVVTFAFGLISPSGWAPLATIGERLKNAKGLEGTPQEMGEYVLRAIQQAPNFARNILCEGDLTKTDVQTSAIGNSIGLIVTQLQTNVQNGVSVVLNNFTVFIDFVSDGIFSTQIQNLNTMTQNLTLALNTYVVSQALQDDNVIITRALDTDINALQLNSSASLAYDTGCGHGYDQWGMCANWWYDSINDISYGLLSKKDTQLNMTSALESVFNEGLTTPELLFANSQVCADLSLSTKGQAPGVSFTMSGAGLGWDTPCISNMQICTWDMAVLSTSNEFTDCPTIPDFALNTCGVGVDQSSALMPISYIGPWLTWGEYEGDVCNNAPGQG